MAEGDEATKVTTESSKKVLKTVAGRLSKLEAGEMPTIQHVYADGKIRQVDHTGEMIRPTAAEAAAAGAPPAPGIDGVGAMDATRAAAEQFAAEHRANPVAPAPRQQPPPRPSEAVVAKDDAPAKQGLWARIKAWFKPS